jgi:hypothetical protein
MAVDFGIDVQLISDDMLLEMLSGWDNYHFAATGQHLEFDKPGMGSIIAGAIRGVEKALITAYEPFIALADVVCKVIPPTPPNILKFLEDAVGIVTSIAELVGGLPMSLLDFIMAKVLEPIIKEWYIPIPSIDDLLLILMGQLDMSTVNWEEKLLNGEMVIPPKLQEGVAAGKDWAGQIAQVLQVKEFLPKVLEFLLMPIKMAIGMLTAVIDKVTEMVTELPKALEGVMSFISDPIGGILELIGEIFKPIIKMMMGIFSPDLPDTPVPDFDELISKLFSGEFLNGDNVKEFIQNSPGSGSAMGPIVLFGGLFNWLIGLLNPEIILAAFIPCSP